MKAVNTYQGFDITIPQPCIVCQQPLSLEPTDKYMNRWFCKKHKRKAEWFNNVTDLTDWIDMQKGLKNYDTE